MHEHVFVLTHHAGIDGRGVVGVYTTVTAAQAAALNHTRRMRAWVSTSGAENLTWDVRDGVFVADVNDDRGLCQGVYSIKRTEVLAEIPAVVGVREAEVDHLAGLVREGLVDLEVFADDDQAEIRVQLEAADWPRI